MAQNSKDIFLAHDACPSSLAGTLFYIVLTSGYRILDNPPSETALFVVMQAREDGF